MLLLAVDVVVCMPKGCEVAFPNMPPPDGVVLVACPKMLVLDEAVGWPNMDVLELCGVIDGAPPNKDDFAVDVDGEPKMLVEDFPPNKLPPLEDGASAGDPNMEDFGCCCCPPNKPCCCP